MTRRRSTQSGLRRRCLACGKLRGFREPPGDQGGEYHPRRLAWVLTPFGLGCGWCANRANVAAIVLRYDLHQAAIVAMSKCCNGDPMHAGPCWRFCPTTGCVLDLRHEGACRQLTDAERNRAHSLIRELLTTRGLAR